MRKVKLLALLLAVLMVVTAFAGCANTDVIESDVANLDERVTALENLLNGIDKEIDDLDAQIKDLGDKIDSDKTADEVAALQKQLEEQKAALEAQKKAAEDAKAAADAAAAAAKKAAEDQAKANADLLKQIQELMKAQEDAEKEAAKVLTDAKTAALAKIATIESGLAGKYADLVAAAKAAVNAATTENACDKAVADLEAAIVAADAAAGAAVLAAAQKAASEEIAVIREQAKGEKAYYFADEYEALVKALATADTNVAAAKTAADVDAVVAALKTELAKYVTFDDKLYDYFIKLWSNLSTENKPLYDEFVEYGEKLEEYLTDLEEKAEDPNALIALSLTIETRLCKYVYGVDENGDNKVVHLPYMLAAVSDIFENGVAVDGGFVYIDMTTHSGEYVTYSELTKAVETYNIAKAEAEAKKLDLRINDFLTNKSYKESYEFLRAERSFSMFGDLNYTYEQFLAYTEILPASVRALVTKLAEIERLKGIIDNYAAAEEALNKLGKVDYTTQTLYNVFEEYGYDYSYDSENNPFYNPETKVYATKAVFNPIDAEIAAWAKAYNLTADDQEDIINDIIAYGDDTFYAGYKADKAYVKLMDDKFAAFKKDIVPLVVALAGQKAVNVSAFEAYKALDAKIASWLSGDTHVAEFKVNGSKVKMYNYVNAENLALMLGLLGEDYAGATFVTDAATHAYKSIAESGKLAFEGARVGYYATSKPSAEWLTAGLVNFKTAEVENFFLNEFTTYKTNADAVNIQIAYLNDLLTARKLYSILPILAIEDKSIQVTYIVNADKGTTGKVYMDLTESDTILSLKDYTGALAFDHGTNGVAGSYNYISELTDVELLFPTSADASTKIKAGTYKDKYRVELNGLTVRTFEEDCAAAGYGDLAEYLIDYDVLATLKANFEKRIKELLDNGATKFIADVKAVKFVELKETDLAANPGNRTYESVYASKSNTASQNVLYVTLADEAAYNTAKATLSAWVNDFAGNAEYMELVDKTFEITIENKFDSPRKLSYTGFTEREILQGYDTKYGNIGGQMKVLLDAKKTFVDALTQLKAAMDLDADLNGANDFTVDGLDTAAVINYSKYTIDDNIYYAWDEIDAFGEVVKYEDKSAFSITTQTTIGDLIVEAYKAYQIFEILNMDFKSDLKGSSEGALKNVTIGGVKATDLIDQLVLIYAKAALIAQLETAAEAGDNNATIVADAIDGIKACTKLQGTDKSAISNWHEYLVKYVTGLTVPSIAGVSYRDGNKASGSVKTKAVALYTVAIG